MTDGKDRDPELNGSRHSGDLKVSSLHLRINFQFAAVVPKHPTCTF